MPLQQLQQQLIENENNDALQIQPPSHSTSHSTSEKVIFWLSYAFFVFPPTAETFVLFLSPLNESSLKKSLLWASIATLAGFIAQITMSLNKKSYFYDAKGDPILMESKTLVSIFLLLISALVTVDSVYNPLKVPSMVSSVLPKYDS